MSKIVVYSCIAGPIDDLITTQQYGQADWVMFTDQPLSGGRWQVRGVRNLFTNPRRNARLLKTISDVLFPEYDYVIWIDGTIELLVTPEELVANYLDATCLAVLQHPERVCIYDEAEMCKTLKLDDEAVIDSQMDKYRLQGYPKVAGLGETKIVLRKNCSLINDFNRDWTYEILNHSLRDQLSFNYVARKNSVKVNYLTNWKKSTEVKYHFHLNKRK